MRREANKAAQQSSASRLITLEYATKKDVNQNFLAISFLFLFQPSAKSHYIQIFTCFPTMLSCILSRLVCQK